MLKRDPMRCSGAVSSRVTGPEWIEQDLAGPDLAESEPREMPALHYQEELPADLALDLRLHEILERALRSTAATGAVVALASGDRMVCRATWGEKTPTTGAFLNTRCGLSGLCVQTREMQRCEDALADPRVNADACRSLDIRSIVVLPVLEGTKLWGIVEIFSASVGAFSDSEVQDLQKLGRRVSRTVQLAVEGGTATPVSDTLAASPETDAEEGETTSPEVLAREIVEASLKNPPVRRRDYRNAALTVAVIGLAVLLGWMVGRAGWSMAVNRSENQLPTNPAEAQAAARVTPPATPSAVVVEPAAAAQPAPEKPMPETTPKAMAAKIPKTVAAEPPGGLVIYEQGKVVFRMAPSPKPSVSGGDAAPVVADAKPEGSAADAPVPVPPQVANRYLLERVEPQYPDEARQQHIQGPVVLNALVGTDGLVRDVKLISGDPLLAKAATDAVQQWRFRPHRSRGRAVEFETRITVNFALP